MSRIIDMSDQEKGPGLLEKSRPFIKAVGVFAVAGAGSGLRGARRDATVSVAGDRDKGRGHGGETRHEEEDCGHGSI